MRLVLYTGKGGVGKTTTAAATAVRAAERGLRTLVASADAAHSLGDVIETPLGPEPIALAPKLDAVELDARTEMNEHWGSIRDYLVQLFRYQGIEEVVAEELALLPGAEELTTLLAIERYTRKRRYDLVVLDCAPTGSSLRLVTLPEVAHSAARLLLRVQRVLSSVVTPLARGVVPAPLPGSAVFRDIEQLLYQKLARLRRLLLSERTSVRLVVTPERMVIDEARRAFTDLCLFELACDAVVMNRFLPAAAANEEFFRDWSRLQEDRLVEVVEHFAPLPVLTAPLQEDEVTGLERLARHGRDLFAGRDPEAVLGTAARLRFARAAGGYDACLPLPGARSQDLDVAKVEDELVVSVAGRRRALKLPRRVAQLPLAAACLEDGVLQVRFGASAVT